MKKICYVVVLFALGALSVGGFSYSGTALAATCGSTLTGDVVVRLGGSNRLETAVAVSQDRFVLDGSAEAGVIARSDDFADGLVAGPVATLMSGTLLLSPPDALPDATAFELQRTVPASKPIFLLGGTSALSPAIEGRLTALGYTDIRRVSGANRYDTAVAAADLFPPGSLIQVGIARGDVFADAVSLGGPAARDVFPILLTYPDALPGPVASFIGTHPSLMGAHIAGGLAAIEQPVEDSLTDVLPGVTRYAGVDRYDTSVKLTEGFYGSTLCAVSLVTGQDFPDALVAGAHAGEKTSGVLLVKPDQIPTSVKDELVAHETTITGGYVYGGASAVDDTVLTTASGLL